jgi:NTE family protein
MSTRAPVKRTRAAKPQATSLATQLAQYERVALMLQGGGALGSYQVGVYKALEAAGCVPSWICGVSIGAINGALIAGNVPERRLQQLEAFWNVIASRPLAPFDVSAQPMQGWLNAASAFLRRAVLILGWPATTRKTRPVFTIRWNCVKPCCNWWTLIGSMIASATAFA